MKTYILAIVSLIASVSTAFGQIKIDIEGGVIPGTSYNHLRILNEGGTKVNLSKDLDEKAKVFYRVRAGYLIGNRHNISALFAPLTINYNGAFGRDVNFNQTVFPGTQPLKVRYKFNSYRLTYRYDFVAGYRWRLGAGLTGKIRDAEVRFKSESSEKAFDNFGFVPLVNFHASYRPNYRWIFTLEGDALASKQGRAEDIFAGVSYQLNPHLGVKLGYRVLEGGADTEEVYNFNWINYISTGILISL